MQLGHAPLAVIQGPGVKDSPSASVATSSISKPGIESSQAHASSPDQLMESLLATRMNGANAVAPKALDAPDLKEISTTEASVDPFAALGKDLASYQVNTQSFPTNSSQREHE